MTCTDKSEEQYEVAVVVRSLVRLRGSQGEGVAERAVREAGRLDWRFCETCGAETPFEDSLCVGCGLGKAPGSRLE